ncbi:unnamed protein product [Rotaria sp. Silwood2]|nr:unnamed protein product [Rotaria sp. Silwood2]
MNRTTISTNTSDFTSDNRFVQIASRSEEFILPCLLLIGTTCNTLTFVVMRRGRMRHSSSCFYMAALAIADTFVLWIGCLNRWLELLDKQRPILACNMCCKLGTFAFFFFADCSVWITVAMTFERYIAVSQPLRASQICTVKRARYMLLLVFTIFFLINAHFLWTFHLSSTVLHCIPLNDQSLFIRYFTWIDSFKYSFSFFRRNAYNDHLIFTCRISSSCEITSTTRRHCSACRLKKCFQQGMKKELIRSLVAISHASSAAVTNRLPYHSIRSTTIDLLSEHDQLSLSFDDWNFLTNIRTSYEQHCIQKFIESHETIPLIPPKQPYRSRLKLQRLIDLKYKYTFIIASFIKHILQLDSLQLSLEDDYHYIKDSFSCLLSVNTSELMKLKVLENLPWEHDQLVLEYIFSEEIIYRLGKILTTFQTLSPNDPLIMKQFVVILALSSRISPLLVKEQYNSKDFDPVPKNLLSSQNYCLTILWKYMIYRLGYNDAVIFSVRFIQNFLHRQVIEAEMIEIIQNRDDHGQFGQLMQMNL